MSAMRALTATIAFLLLVPAARAADIPPSGTLDTRGFADLRLTGEPTSRLGVAVAPAGDVNGDGRNDVIVGAPRHDGGGKTNRGAAWVVFGAESGKVADASGFRIDGGAAFDTAGAA